MHAVAVPYTINNIVFSYKRNSLKISLYKTKKGDKMLNVQNPRFAEHENGVFFIARAPKLNMHACMHAATVERWEELLQLYFFEVSSFLFPVNRARNEDRRSLHVCGRRKYNSVWSIWLELRLRSPSGSWSWISVLESVGIKAVDGRGLASYVEKRPS